MLVDEEEDDDDHGTFPDNVDTSNDAAVVKLPAPLGVSAEENTMNGNESDDNSDDDSDDDSGDKSDDNSGDNSDDNSGDNSDDNSGNNSDDNSDDDSGNGGDNEGDQQAKDQPIDAVHPKKRAYKKIAYTRSSRKARDADVALNENAVSRKINPTNLMGDVVASLHPMRAMRPGRIESCLIHSLKESFPRMNDQDRSLLSGHLLETIQTMTRVHTDLLREGLLVTDLYIARTFGTFPAVDGVRGREHGDKRMEHFNNILLKGSRDSFFQRLVNRLIRWGSDDSDLKKASSPALVASDKIFQEYLQITSQRQAPPFRLRDRDVCEGSFMSQCARTLSDMVGGHLYKFSLELKKRVSHLNKSHLVPIMHADTDPATLTTHYRH